MEKLNFEQPLLQSSEPCDPSEIILIYWLGAPKKSNNIYSKTIKISLLKIGVLIFFQDTLMNKE